MKGTAKFFVIAEALLSIAASALAVGEPSPLQTPAPGQHGPQIPQTAGDVSAAQKKEFIRMLDTLPKNGEFYSDEAIEKARPYLPVLLALTKKDIARDGIYPFAAISRGLCDDPESRTYVVRHFKEFHHPLLKLMWAAMIFDANDASPEVVRFLQNAVRSKAHAHSLSEIVGPDFEDFKKRCWEPLYTRSNDHRSTRKNRKTARAGDPSHRKNIETSFSPRLPELLRRRSDPNP